MNQYIFDPEKATYNLEYINTKRPKKDGTLSKPHGPYWYAHWFDEQGKFKSAYIGKELPDDLKPYVKDWATHVANKADTSKRRGPNRSYTGIKEVLDRGNQVVIDISAIAGYLNARVTQEGQDRYILYRDPK